MDRYDPTEVALLALTATPFIASSHNNGRLVSYAALTRT
jgi:hypothetical protein